MRHTIVTTKEQLKEAMDSGVDEIVVKGEFADKLHKTKKIGKLSGASLAALMALGGGAAALAPVTGGISIFAIAPIAALTGIEIAIIIIALSIGISLIIAVAKDYEEISYEDGKMILRKKRKDDD